MDADGNCVGDLTSPNLEPPVSTSTEVIEIMDLETRARHYSWLNNDASFTKTNKIYDFLTENASSSVAIEEAKLLIDIEIAQERGWDFSENGTYIGRSTLKYKAK